jgi:cytochrome c oxidase subunit 2
VIWRPGWGSTMAPARWIVLGGLALPAAVLLPLVGYALFAGEQLLPLPGSTPLRIEVVARQWSWTFHYPEQGGVSTENAMHVPAGTPIDLIISSDDVIHSFWVPKLAGKMDAVPGRVNRLRIQADEPGRYLGLCNEFCGQGHASMRFDVIAHPPQDYAAALTQAVRSRQATTP